MNALVSCCPAPAERLGVSLLPTKVSYLERHCEASITRRSRQAITPSCTNGPIGPPVASRPSMPWERVARAAKARLVRTRAEYAERFVLQAVQS